MSVVVTRTAKVATRTTKKASDPSKPTRSVKKAPSPSGLKALRGVAPEALKKHPISTFAHNVYALTQDIPEGYVTTYGAMAKVLNSSPRAVGQALRHNPFAPIVPCHRVISQTGFGGFHGAVDGYQLSRKVKLLRAEGVQLTDDPKVTDDDLNFSSVVVEGKSILSHEEFEEKLKALSKGYVLGTSEVKSEATNTSPAL